MRFLDWSFCILLPLQVLAQHSILRARQSPVPTGFTEVGTPSADTSINLRIGLKAVDNPGLEQKLYKISTPGSASYGQHLTRDEVKNLLRL